MARTKRKSAVIQKAKNRLAGLKAISESMDLGNGLSVAEYDAKIQETENKLEVYNERLSQADADLNEFDKSEAFLNELNSRILESVAAVYGHDSNEYEKAGGKRKSDRKRPLRKSKAA